MKTLILTFISLLLLSHVYAQSVIKDPITGMSTANGLQITKVERTDSATTLFFHYNGRPGSWIYIPKESFIKPVGSEGRLFATAVDNLPFNQSYTLSGNGKIDYAIHFPVIADSVSKIDFGEGNSGGNWFIYDISLSEPGEFAMVPQWLYGDWYKTGSDQWAISFLDSLAIYQQKLWKYESVDLKKNKVTLTAMNGDDHISLVINKEKDESCSIASGEGEPEMFCKEATNLSSSIDSESFGEVKLKADTTLLSGYIINYSPRAGVNTFQIYVDDILTGGQKTVTVEIQPDGTFSVKVPLNHPQSVYVRSGLMDNQIYLEPGSPLFMYVVPNRKRLLMGETARMNNELKQLKSCLSNHYSQFEEKVLTLPAMDCKAYLVDLWKKDLQTLDDSTHTGHYSAKAVQITKAEIDYAYAEQLLGYRMYFDMYYRQKHEISYRDRDVVIPMDTLTSDYFDFLTLELANNPIAFCSNSYSTFINRLEYLQEVRGEGQFQVSSPNDLFKYLKSTGYPFTESEKNTLNVALEIDSLQKSPEIVDLNKKYSAQEQQFYTKYKQELAGFHENHDQQAANIGEFARYLEDNGYVLTDDENQYVAASTEFSQNTVNLKINELQQDNSDSLRAFHQRYAPLMDGFLQKQVARTRENNLKEKFGIMPGLATDIMRSQGFLRGIVSEMTPVTKEQLSSMKEEFTRKDVAEYLETCNKATLAKIALNKTKTGYSINEAPKNAGDKLFEEIMTKYQGKVVYVDFWATWCGPCRAGIEDIKPLKEEVKDEDIVFVYITGPSSPENTWKNMIPDIKGEHYRVSADEWNFLCGRFNITGIPHCILVGKDGQIINPHLPHMANGQLKELLSKYL